MGRHRNINRADLDGLATYDDLSAMERRVMKLARRGSNKTDTFTSRYGGNFEIVEREYYNIYYDYLVNLIINLIKYKNAPLTLDGRFLEYNLRCFGYCRVGGTDKENVFVLKNNKQPSNFDTTQLGFLADATSVKNPFNPVEFEELNHIERTNFQELDKGYITISNKFSYYLSGVASMFTDFKLIDRTAMTLAKIKATEVFNLNQMKVPYVVFTKNKNLTGVNIWEEINQGLPVIEVDAEASRNINEFIQVANLNVPNFLPVLKDAWNNEIDEMLTMLGINNVGVDKKERLVANEANSNSQLIEASGNIYLEARNEQLELLNRVLGTQIHAEFNQESYQALVSLKNNDPTAGNVKTNDEGSED